MVGSQEIVVSVHLRPGKYWDEEGTGQGAVHIFGDTPVMYLHNGPDYLFLK